MIGCLGSICPGELMTCRESVTWFSKSGARSPRRKRWFLFSLLMLLAIPLLAACGVEDPSTPTPTDSPIPTATPAATPESFATVTSQPTERTGPTGTPAPTSEPTLRPVPTPTPIPNPGPHPTATPLPFPVPTATPVPDPQESGGLSGEEVLSMLTEEEKGCLRDSFGEELLDRVRELRISSHLANHPASRFLFDCITQDTINEVGLALIAADAQLSENTRACILEVLLKDPGAVELRIGRMPEDIDADAVHLLEAGTATIQCLNDEEALATFRQMNFLLDQRSALRGRDILQMLSPEERSCVQSQVDNSVLKSIQGATVMVTFTAAQPIFSCTDQNKLSAIFLHVSNSRLGELSNETQVCASGVLTAAVARDLHPHMLELTLYIADYNPEHYEEAIALYREIFGCMNADELLEVQRAIADALHRE